MSSDFLDRILSPETVAMIQASQAKSAVAPNPADVSGPAKLVVPVCTPLLKSLPRRMMGGSAELAVSYNGPVPRLDGDVPAQQLCRMLYGLKLAQEAALYFALVASPLSDIVGRDFPVSGEAVAALVERGVALEADMDHYTCRKGDADGEPTLTVAGHIGLVIPSQE